MGFAIQLAVGKDSYVLQRKILRFFLYICNWRSTQRFPYMPSVERKKAKQNPKNDVTVEAYVNASCLSRLSKLSEWEDICNSRCNTGVNDSRGKWEICLNRRFSYFYTFCSDTLG
jgi:hypothetical protein